MSESWQNSTEKLSKFTESFLIEKQALLVKEVQKRGVLIDGVPQENSSLTPYFMTSEKYAKLSNLCELVVGAIEKFLRLYVDSAEIQNLFPELELHRDLSCIIPTVPNWIHHCRFDLIETPSGEFKLLETNASCPALVQPTVFRQIYKEIFLTDFVDNHLCVVDQPIDNPTFYIETMIERSRVSLGNLKPNLGFLSSSYRKMNTDFDQLEKMAKEMGYSAACTDIQNLIEKNGKIWFEEMPLDVVVQKIDSDDEEGILCLYENSREEVKVYLDGIQTNKLILMNPFISCMVAGSKRIVALIQRPQFRKYFTVEENVAIDSICPETHSFDYTNRDEFETLFESFLTNQNEYVIKGAAGRRGRTVWLGRDTDVELWKELLGRLKDGPYVIQRYVYQTRTKVYDSSPCPILKDMTSTLGVHLVKGKAVGLDVRSSESGIDNTSGTGLGRAPFIVDQM